MKLEVILIAVVTIITIAVLPVNGSNPYELQQQRCDQSVAELEDFKAHPEKYPNSYQGMA